MSHGLPSDLPPWRPHELLLADWPIEGAADRVLCNTAGRGQFAVQCAERHPSSEVTCLLSDFYLYEQCSGIRLPNLNWCCLADPPDSEFGLVALALGQNGEAELTRELLQSGHQRLALGGQMIVATDNPDDRWLGDQLRAIFKRVLRQAHSTGVRYLAKKTDPLKRPRRFDCEFAFRDKEQIIHLKSRPGVFSHRHLDPGARALLRALDVVAGMQVLDLGCGSGAVGLAAALRASQVRVLALDSSPRAIECTAWGAERNAVPTLIARLDHDGSTILHAPPDAWYGPRTFDLVATNPPYFSHFKIADRMLDTAEQALLPDGQLLVVTKSPEWYDERLSESFRDVEFLDGKTFIVVRATRK